MQQLIKVWAGLGLGRQILAILATGITFFAIVAMSRLATMPTMTLLYAGLESRSAGDVISALEQGGVRYEVRGGAVFVEAQRRDELRLTLASEGLPSNGSRGYEILDDLTGFGTTSQMFDAAYWRAKEGELARTILASPNITSARVHIANTGSNPFQRNLNSKASVSLVANEMEITSAQANAVRFLVASAVAGLDPTDVAVIDANGALITASDDVPASVGGLEMATSIRDRVTRMLEARVGAGNAVVEVSVDTITETEAFRELIFDPDGRVALSTDTEERSNTAQGGANGAVTVASNLPDQENDAGGERSSSQNSETRERINYEISETEREIVRSPGGIKRMTIAVLVNEPTITTPDGKVAPDPRGGEEMLALEELISSAVGFDEDRGDRITLKSMPFVSLPPSGTVMKRSFGDQFRIDLTSAMQMAILAFVTLILGLFVIRPILSQPKRNQLENPKGIPDLSQNIDGESQNVLDGEVADDDFEFPMMQMGEGLSESLPNLPEVAGVANDPTSRLRSIIGDRQEETVEVLRSWLEEKEERV